MDRSSLVDYEDGIYLWDTKAKKSGETPRERESGVLGRTFSADSQFLSASTWN
jgi:hypothetical protein